MEGKKLVEFIFLENILTLHLKFFSRSLEFVQKKTRFDFNQFIYFIFSINIFQL